MQFDLVKRESSIHGHGVFTSDKIPIDSLIIEYTGKILTPIAAEVRDRLYDQQGTTYLFKVNKDRVIDGGQGGNISIYMNHSCDPNCRFEIKNKRVFIYAKKTIEAGEELTFDYKYGKEDLRSYCNCKSSRCRGTINVK